MSTSKLNKPKVRSEFYKSITINPYIDMAGRMALLPTGVIGDSADYAFANRPDAPRKREGAYAFRDMTAEKVTIKNSEFVSGTQVRKRDLRRDETGTIQRHFGGLGRVFAQHIFNLAIDVVNAGETAASSGGFDGYDGQPLFSASHATGQSGTQINLLTNTQVPTLDVVTPTSPTPEEAAEALMDVIAYMHSYKDHAGQGLQEDAREFLVLCKPRMSGKLRTAIKANNLAGGENSPVAVANADGFNIMLAQSARLTIADAAFVVFVADRVGERGIIVQEEQPVELNIFDESSDKYKETGQYAAIAEWAGGHGIGEPLNVAKATFS